ncbi:5-oxoprolinase subunit C family protein [Microbulbifer pacificus]|uniref:Biotin-dependent carboxyltransferase family protein n=1 Tax=Microbulbifer pacificus TaxID=407164 RepID=A0AAU0N1A3_9GAMM|nr:biotin-dependent carboxyltransferase family protein [Microbulbifer pacificus]WOX06732.1 biotin-dependent carboxyltransferase family protein [Microbulbifer pacificus]
MLRILKAGLQTSIQDGGRSGWMQYGIAKGGAADPVAMQLANSLLGNPPHHPCLEITLTGPDIEFGCDLSIAICGAQFDLTLNGQSIDNDQGIAVKKGDHLAFGPLQSGARAYLALSAETVLPAAFGSLSTHIQTEFGGYCGRALRAGDEIRLRNCRREPPRQLSNDYQLRYSARPQIRVIDGAEAEMFADTARELFYRTTYSVSAQSNRMGIRLAGNGLDTAGLPQMTSSGLCPGSVQIPPDGSPIISFVEGQTIGGYPRLAHVISADQHLLGQLKPHDRIDFFRVDLDTAIRILRDKTAELSRLIE